MATEVTSGFTVTGIANPDAIQSFFHKQLLTRAFVKLIGQIPVTKYPLSRRSGKTMIWRKYTPLAVSTTALTEGVTPTEDDLTLADKSATLAQYGRGFILSDFLLDTQPEAVEVEAIDILAQNFGETFNRLYNDEWVTGTNSIFGGNATSRATVDSTDIFDVGDFNRAYTDLQNRSAVEFTPVIEASQKVGTLPVMPSYWCLTNSSVMFDVRAMNGFLLPSEYANSTGLVMGEGGALKVGIRFLVTQHKTTANDNFFFFQAGAGSINVHAAVIMGREAMGGVNLAETNGGIIRHAPGESGSADFLNQRASVGWKKADAREILDDNFLTRIEAAVS